MDPPQRLDKKRLQILIWCKEGYRVNYYPQKSPLDKGKVRTQDRLTACYARFKQIERGFYIGIFRYVREKSEEADSSDLPVSGDPCRTHTNEESAPICHDRQV